MTVQELKDALDALIKGDKGNEPVCLEAAGVTYELKSVSVIVKSDLWVPETVVLTVEEVVEEQ